MMRSDGTHLRMIATNLRSTAWAPSGDLIIGTRYRGLGSYRACRDLFLIDGKGTDLGPVTTNCEQLAPTEENDVESPSWQPVP